MDGQLSFQCIPENHLDLGCWPRYCVMLRSQGMNWKSYLLKRRCRPTSPSSGQATTSNQLRHPMLLACHSRAALGGGQRGGRRGSGSFWRGARGIGWPRGGCRGWVPGVLGGGREAAARGVRGAGGDRGLIRWLSWDRGRRGRGGAGGHAALPIGASQLSTFDCGCGVAMATDGI